jgi:serine protease Do
LKLRKTLSAVRLAALCWVLVSPAPSFGQRSSDRALARLQELSEHFQALSERVSPAVVQIIASGYTPLQRGDAPGTGLLTRRQVGGAGVILDPNGYIVTNRHVIEGAGRIRVRLPIPFDDAVPGESILKPEGKIVGARIIGIDWETDLAVLKVDETDLPHLTLGDSDDVRTGQLVFAFGSPLGLENTVTMGIVSAVARQLRPEDPMIYLQTDAPINPGNSGGPLVDAAGRVVGINTLIISQSGGSEGLGFAAPSNIVRNVFTQIKNTGYVRRGVIGVYAQTMNPTMAAGLGLTRDWGVLLGDVYPNSPAQQAGLQVGDMVLAVDNKVMENGRQFEVNLYGYPPGTSVAVRVLRGSDQLTVQVPVVEREDEVSRLSVMVTPDENLVPRLGILAIDLTPRIAAFLPALRDDVGVVVAARSPDATYGRLALEPGDVIHSLNRQRVSSLGELRAAMDQIGAGQSVVLQIERRGQFRFLAFELE